MKAKKNHWTRFKLIVSTWILIPPPNTEVSEPPERGSGIVVESVEQLVDKLKERSEGNTMTVLVIAENDNQVIKPAVLNTLGATYSQLSGDTHLLVAGSNAGSVVEQAKTLSGVTKILYSEAGHFENPVAEDVSRLIVGLAPGYEHILAPATSFGKNLLPRVAALLDVAQISDIVNIESDDTFETDIRWKRHGKS